MCEKWHMSEQKTEKQSNEQSVEICVFAEKYLIEDNLLFGSLLLYIK